MPTPSDADIPQPVPIEVSLAGSSRPDISRFLNVRTAVAPSLSPDGKRLAFTANPSGVDNIYVMNMDSLKSYPVTNVLTGCFNPSWSKDGDRLAFACFYKGGFDIFVLKDPKPVVKPGEELALQGEWDQRDNQGRAVAPGSYLVRGAFREGDPGVRTLETEPVTLSISR